MGRLIKACLRTEIECMSHTNASTNKDERPYVEDQATLADESLNARDESAGKAVDAEMSMVAPQVGALPAGKSKLRSQQVSKAKAAVYPDEFEGCEPPATMWQDRVIGHREYVVPRTSPPRTVRGIRHLRGYGHVTAPLDVLFVSSCALQEELDGGAMQRPRMLRGGAGSLFLRSLERAGFQDEQWYYTAIAKYNLPRLKLRPVDIRWGLPALEDEIRTLRPRMIVCLGKQVFDFFMAPKKFAMRDVQGALFFSEKYQTAIYPMDSLVVPAYKPEYLDRFMVDLVQVSRELSFLKGEQRVQVTTSYGVIENYAQLQGFASHMDSVRPLSIAVDCEWAGQTAWSGRLRSLQMGWGPGQAVYLRLMDDRLNYAFDRPLTDVGPVVQSILSRSWMAGHNASADMPWIHHHLGVEVYRRFWFDTMYAMHTLNESADLKLERLAVQFTDLGRYDLDLLLWKKAHKFDEDDNEGYGRVPDSILIPYALRDVDSTVRITTPLMLRLIEADMQDYYRNFLLPFVTDGFFEMMDCGLPINMQLLDEMRDTFTRNRDWLLVDFRKELFSEACDKLLAALTDMVGDRAQSVHAEMLQLWHQGTAEALAQAEALFKSCTRDHRDLSRFFPLLQHWSVAATFNVDNTSQVARWLFAVKGLTPIKTTKRDGVSLSWDRVLQMDAKKRLEMNPQPAADKQVIKIYAEKDRMVARLQELKSVATIVKSFLKGPDEHGREQGMHKWVQPDGRIHTNFALTETARPRSWKPNLLNWPKAVTKPIEAAFKRIHAEVERDLRQQLAKLSQNQEQDRLALEAELVRQTRKAVSLRANIEAPEGWCIVDMDLKTAEIVALAYQSADANMIQVLTEADTQFARVDASNPKKVVRVAYTHASCYPESQQDPSLLVSLDDPKLLRKADGSLMHPRRDLHWEMAEAVAKKPREKLDERLFRDGVGKVGNFCLLMSSRVLTSRGEVAIQDVRADDLLWDGQEWVAHGGVVCNGVKTTYYYQGLWATDNHEVWIEDGRKVLFGDARRRGWNLLRAALPDGEVAGCAGSLGAHSEYGAAFKKRSLRAVDAMPALWTQGQEILGQAGAWTIAALHLSGGSEKQLRLQRSSCLYVANSLSHHDTTVLFRFTPLIAPLQRTWDTGEVQIMSGVRAMGASEVARHRFQRFGVRPDRQRRSLLKGEHSTDNTQCQSVEHYSDATGQYGDGQTVSFQASGGYLYRHNDSSQNVQGNDRRSDCGVLEERSACWMEKEGRQDDQASLTRTGLVYDILNAGPRHRFVCEGVLVSNSIPYGATDQLLERMVEANTGIRPQKNMGQDMIEAWKTRYPKAAEFQLMMEETVRDPGFWKSLSGRVRHFAYASLDDLHGYEAYKKRGIFSGLARQARNFPCQEIVAATTGKALLMFIEQRRQMQLQSRIGILLYDAMTAFTPLTQLKPTRDLLQSCLTVQNQWPSAGGTFHFEVDIAIGFRWGVKPTADQAKHLESYLK